MAYRLCTFDSFGKLISIDPAKYSDDQDVIPTTTTFNPNVFSFVDESLLTGVAVSDFGSDIADGSPDLIGEDISISFPNRSAQYDPRVEVTLYMPNPHPYLVHNRKVVQDITKVTTVFNTSDRNTRPVHSTTQKKFGPTSGKFTRSDVGYTGGFLYITNLSKTDYAGVSAPHNDIARTGVPSYSMELFFYPTTFANNFTLLQKGPTGASANWKLGFDSSAGFLQFAWQSYGSTGGYNYSQNIINVSGMTTNSWQHVAVSVVRNTGTAGIVSYLISGYFNGTNRFSVGVTSGTFPETRYGNGIYVGNNHLGTEGFNGYIDSLRILESGTTTGFFGPSGYGFLPYASGTLGVPTLSGFTRSSQTIAILNFNGLPESNNFYGESLDYISGTVANIVPLTLESAGFTAGSVTNLVGMGVRDIVRYTIGYTAGATAYSDPTGFSLSYGAIVSPFVNSAAPGTTAYYSHGYDYIFGLNSIYDNAPDINVFRIFYRNDLQYDRSMELLHEIEGIAGNIGSSGNVYNPQRGQNPFRRLFGSSGNAYGVSLTHNSLFIDPTNADTMKYIMDNGLLVSQGISASVYNFTDSKGIERRLTATEISNLRLDILEYQNNLKNYSKSVKETINAAATKNEIKFAKVNKASGSAEVSVPEGLE
jgi:hypothetical protein